MEESETVDIRVEFTWKFVGRVSIDPETRKPRFPSTDPTGVYRLRSGVRTEPFDCDCWYVGRSLPDVDKRIDVHMSEAYDPSRRRLKRFKANLEHPDGWVELDRAIDVKINGSPHLRLSPPGKRSDDQDEFETVEIVWNLIEAAGMVANLDVMGRANKR